MENLDLPFALRFKDIRVAQLPKSIHCRPRSIEGWIASEMEKSINLNFTILLWSTANNKAAWVISLFVAQYMVCAEPQIKHCIATRYFATYPVANFAFSMQTCGLGRYRLSNEWKSYQMQYTSRCCYQQKILPVTLQWLSNNARTLLLHESLHWDWESPAQLSAYAENYYQFPEAWMVDTFDSDTTQEIFAHQKKSILHSEWNRQTPSSDLIKS